MQIAPIYCLPHLHTLLDTNNRISTHTRAPCKQDAVLGDYLRITYSLRSDTQWAPKGTVLGWEQFEVAAPHAAAKAADAKMEDVKVAEEGNLIRVHNKVFSAEVDKTNGELVSYVADGKEVCFG